MTNEYTFGRRGFLTGSLFASLAAMVPSATLARKGAGKHVAIVGAGFAAAGAAATLRHAGCRTTVLEARDRIGGRAWSGGRLAVPVDMGAAWLHAETSKDLARAVRDAGIRVGPSDYSSAQIADLDSQPVTLDPVAGMVSGNTFGDEEMERRMGSAAQQDFARWRRTGASSRHSIADYWVRAFPEGGTISRANRLALEIQLAATIDATGPEGFFAASDTPRRWANPGGGELFMGGNMQPLAAHLLRDADVELSAPVSAIDWSGEKVRLTSGSRSWDCDAVIVTQSIGLLKSGQIAFFPHFPEGHSQALNNLEMGLLNKIFIQYPAGAQLQQGDFLMMLEGRGGTVSVRQSLVDGRTIVAVLCDPVLSARVEQLDDREAANIAHRLIARALGRGIPEPEQSFSTRWRSDPWALGSYAHARVGATGREIGQLSRPIGGKVFLAGEALCPWEVGTVTAAYASGALAAERILRS